MHVLNVVSSILLLTGYCDGVVSHKAFHALRPFLIYFESSSEL
jgi:hypothetical protein